MKISRDKSLKLLFTLVQDYIYTQLLTDLEFFRPSNFNVWQFGTPLSYKDAQYLIGKSQLRINCVFLNKKSLQQFEGDLFWLKIPQFCFIKQLFSGFDWTLLYVVHKEPEKCASLRDPPSKPYSLISGQYLSRARHLLYLLSTYSSCP